MVKPEDLLHAYDGFRRQARLYGLAREEISSDGVTIVRHLTPEGAGTIVYARLEPAAAESAIRDQIDYFRRRAAPVEWLVYTHDRPADLGRRLRGHDFLPDEPATVLLLPLAEVSLAPADAGVAVRRATTPAELAAVAAIRAQTWGGDADAMARRLQEQARERPEEVFVYLATVDGEPAATGQLTLYPDLGLASLGSAATVPAYRRRGLYRALLRERLLLAQARGVDYVDTEASPMSRPLLEQVGFYPISEVTVYTWEPEEAAG